MLGQAISMVVPRVVGFRLHGALPGGLDRHRPRPHRRRAAARATAWSASSSSSTDRACRTSRSRTGRPSATCRRSTGRRSPSSRSTTRPCGTCASPAAPSTRSRWSRPTPRSRDSGSTPPRRPTYSETLELDLSTVVPSLAGPSRPQDRVPLDRAKEMFAAALVSSLPDAAAGAAPYAARAPSTRRPRSRSPPATPPRPAPRPTTRAARLARHGARRRSGRRDRPRAPRARHAGRRDDVRARPRPRRASPRSPSCTNTSNPSVMLTAALLARNAVQRGLTHEAVGQDHARARLQGRHRLLRPRRAHALPRPARLQPRRLRLHDLHRQLRPARARDLRRGQRARPRRRRRALRQPQLRGPHQPRRAHELPRARRRWSSRTRSRARWTSTCTTSRWAPGPTASRSSSATSGPTPPRSPRRSSSAVAVRHVPRDVRRGVHGRRALARAARARGRSLHVGRHVDVRAQAAVLRRHARRAGPGARPSAARGCSPSSATASRPTTSRPPGSIRADSPAGRWLIDHGVQPADFNSYGARRGNHEVMLRGTFANIRLRNRLAPGHRGRLHAAPPRRRADDDLRRGDAVRRGAGAAGRARGQGVRDGVVTRLGGEGHVAARRARRHRRELRAHPPLEPDRHGRARRCSSRASRSSHSGSTATSCSRSAGSPATSCRTVVTVTAEGPSTSSRSRATCASTPRWSSSTTATAASSSTSSANSPANRAAHEILLLGTLRVRIRHRNVPTRRCSGSAIPTATSSWWSSPADRPA